MITYNRYDIGGTTEKFNNGNGFWKRTTFNTAYDDITIKITKKYHLKPWMVAHDFYGDASLSWLVLQYNGILDTITEFTEGNTIKIPSQNRLKMSII